jgi:hypothetical protein
MQVHITMKSSNAKTGPIPVSTTSAESCPNSCSLKGNGCYASSGPLALHWRKVTEGERGTDWNTFCDTIAAMPEGQVWRHNQAGDLSGNGRHIDFDALRQLVQANTGKRGFTYTHYDMSDEGNRRCVEWANESGFTVNLSAESLLEADKLKALNVGPVVTLIPETDVKTLTTQAGNHVVICPATYRDDVSCATCQLCQRQRDSIVAFPVHGTAKAKARKVFMLKNVTQ